MLTQSPSKASLICSRFMIGPIGRASSDRASIELIAAAPLSQIGKPGSPIRLSLRSLERRQCRMRLALNLFQDFHLHGASAPEWNQRYLQMSQGTMHSCLAEATAGN